MDGGGGAWLAANPGCNEATCIRQEGAGVLPACIAYVASNICLQHSLPTVWGMRVAIFKAANHAGGGYKEGRQLACSVHETAGLAGMPCVRRWRCNNNTRAVRPCIPARPSEAPLVTFWKLLPYQAPERRAQVLWFGFCFTALSVCVACRLRMDGCGGRARQ